MSNTSYHFEDNGKFYKRTKDRKGNNTVCEVAQCRCGDWISTKIIKTPHHLAGTRHRTWAQANGEALTEPYKKGNGDKAGAKPKTDKKPKKEDLVQAINKVAEKIQTLRADFKAEMKSLVETFNTLTDKIEALDDDEVQQREPEPDEEEEEILPPEVIAEEEAEHVEAPAPPAPNVYEMMAQDQAEYEAEQAEEVALPEPETEEQRYKRIYDRYNGDMTKVVTKEDRAWYTINKKRFKCKN
jgi:hypothetical protein